MADMVCTIAQVKARLDITDATHDALLTEIVEQVTDELEQFTGRKLVPEAAATYVVDTGLGHRIPFPLGIRSVTSVGIAHTDQPDAGGTYTAVTLADVLLRPATADRRPGWPATEILLKSGPIDTRIPLRSAANGARIVGDFGFNPVLPGVARIGITASVAEYLDRRQAGSAGAGGIDLPNLLDAGQLAYLARIRAGGYGMGIA